MRHFRTSYPSTARAYQKSGEFPLDAQRRVLTFNSTSVLVPGVGAGVLNTFLANAADVTPSAAAAPVFFFSTREMSRMTICPMLAGTSGGGADPSGKFAVFSVILCKFIGDVPPLDADPVGAEVRRNLLGQFKVTGGGSDYIVPARVGGKVFNNASASFAKRVYASDVERLSDVRFLLPSGLVRVGANTWSLDTADADFVEIAASCVDGVSGTPVQSASGFGALIGFLDT